MVDKPVEGVGHPFAAPATKPGGMVRCDEKMVGEINQKRRSRRAGSRIMTCNDPRPPGPGPVTPHRRRRERPGGPGSGCDGRVARKTPVWSGLSRQRRHRCGVRDAARRGLGVAPASCARARVARPRPRPSGPVV